MNQTNQSIIDEWSKFSEEDLLKFGDEGDNARKTLIDPILFKLAGEVNKKSILDAGCGNGYLARKLARLGANVTGLEPALSLFEYCKMREAEERLDIEYLQQDISSIDIANTYDIVFLVNVLMDIPDRLPALIGCVESLKPGGVIIISLLHPCFPGFETDWQEQGFVKVSEYFNTMPTKQKYGYIFNWPISEYINALIQAGCAIERVEEPIARDSQLRSAHVPQFLIIKATKLKI